MYERTFKNIRNSSSEVHQNISAMAEQASPIAVVTNGPWSAKVICQYIGVSQDMGLGSNDWLQIDPSEGQNPGLHEIEVGLSRNTSPYTRIASIEVECMGEKLVYVVEQAPIK